MKFSNTILLSIATVITSVSAGCSYVSGNYYCSEVDAVVYSNVGYSGSYSDVTNMNENTCECTQKSVSFEGTNSPLDEELSVHFRGPLKLLQFGVYYPSSSSSNAKRDVVEDCTTTQHIHHAHKREAATTVVEVTQTVFVDANGNLVTNQGSVETSTTPAVEASSYAAVDRNVASSSSSAKEEQSSTSTGLTTTLSSNLAASSSSISTSGAASLSSSSSSSSSGAWNRVAYYKPGSTSNVTFLNTKGGSSSGTWSSCFGNSLSYAASNGVDAASSAIALDEVTLKSDEEYCIFSGSSCSDGSTSGDCGYYRSDIPAYHGFGGAQKMFVFEFQMPTDSSTSGASNPDMPAIWLLNAKIPRTLQYGNSDCSCWSTGCGELDLFEVLTTGESKLISHIHDGQGSNGNKNGGGGSQDYFTRPTSGSMKGAAIFNSDGTIHVVQLDSGSDFASSLSSSTVTSWLGQTGGTAKLS